MYANTDKAPHFITLASYPQAIVHVDCDAFFVSCEQARNPRLKKLPVVTGKERGIVSCPSYQAKALGIKRGMMLTEAKKIYPNLVILPSDYELYSIYSNRLFSILRRFTPQVEEYSIDEAFCDLTGLRRLYRTSYPNIAHKIKETIQNELDITVSVGLSLSKTLAKICSKQNKPDGFLAIEGIDLHKLLKNVPLDAVCGFGSNTVALLSKQGIETIFEYVNRPWKFAQRLLGKIGLELWQELRGIYVYKVCTEQKHKYLTISKTKTFMPPSKDSDFVKAKLIRNLESAFIKLRRHELSAKTLTIYLKKTDFTYQGMQACLNRHSSATLDFIDVCCRLFEYVFEVNTFYRATGVVLSDITDDGIDRITLFDDPLAVERVCRISQAMDEINLSYGKHTVYIGSAHFASVKGAHPRNCVATRKIDLLKGETFRKRLGIPLLRLD